MEIHFNYTTYPKKNLSTGNSIFGDQESGTIHTFSGKSAIAHVLRYYRSADVLRDKNDRVLVPKWLGSWIYMTMHHHTFPTTVADDGLRGVMVYHQWGFPQKMEEILDFCKKNGLFCIEDCAHAFSSSYRGQRAGTFGDASIWSFSKFFPSVVGGAVYSRHSEIFEFIKALQQKSDTHLEEESFKQRVSFDKKPNEKNAVELEKHYAIYPRLLQCPAYSRQVTAAEIEAGALQKRKENFQILKDVFWGLREQQLIADSDVIPWVVPLYLGSKNAHVAKALSEVGVESGVYNFDVNRTILDSDFQKCVPIPCHHGITDRQMATIIDTVKEVI